MQSESNTVHRESIHVNGIVQGVGFRPFIYNLAASLQLGGYVSNNSDGVIIEVEGNDQQIDAFVTDLKEKAPPLADIIDIQRRVVPSTGDSRFTIRPSQDKQDNQTLISPDIAICDDCLQELFDPNDRRYLYPFINCTNCGPRYTIIRKIPYDRPNTTMCTFEMCPQCRREYDDPQNRRFHAQPNACPQCGPEIWLETNKNPEISHSNGNVFINSVRLLDEGSILAVKGLGGFHLAVDAYNDAAVRRLRQRKNREEKPLALMTDDVETIRQFCTITESERELLEDKRRPIVLLQKKNSNALSPSLAPGNKRLGFMLAYTPLHYVLFYYIRKQLNMDHPVLVMTSANRSEEPIAMTNEDARQRLSDIADGYLMHNRDIAVRADDSVTVLFSEKPEFLRRSRGYVPRPVMMDINGPSVLGLGGELKNTICILKNRYAFLSQHIGDLENYRAHQFFTASVEHLQAILDVDPHGIACDMHPAYFSRQWANGQTHKTVFKIQHHHAHLASVMAEHHLDQPVIGIILDGTGYGYDQTIWGGEVLIGDYLNLERYAWLEPMPLPGGDQAIKEPWRTAVSYLYKTFGPALPHLQLSEDKPSHLITEMIDKNINSPQTSSCGRLFDAAATIAGGRQTIRYEAQAAIELMQSVDHINVSPLDYSCEAPVIPVQPLIRAVARAALDGQPQSIIAARFHRTLIDLFADLAEKAAQDSGISTIVLSGGVFQNEILHNGLIASIESKGLRVYTNHQVPVNDGGIALGQTVIARHLLKQGNNSVLYQHYNH
ncbi:MAG: carbamoyltransferase HypF [Caldithrix sp.]|nr:carbamoyltransferase HypF [Caldithrix sp.]